MGAMEGMLMMVNRDYSQVGVVGMAGNRAGFGEDDWKPVCVQTTGSFHEMIL